MFACFKKKKRPQPPAPQELPEEQQPQEVPSPDDLEINQEGLDMIAHFEGFYSEPYLCPAGIPTIGLGTIKYPNGRKVTLQDPPCTLEEAQKWLAWELDGKEKVINNFLLSNNIQLNENEFSALVSFAYNLGTGPITSGGKTMNLALLSGNKLRIADAFLVYNKARVGIFRMKLIRIFFRLLLFLLCFFSLLYWGLFVKLFVHLLFTGNLSASKLKMNTVESYYTKP